VPLAPVPGPGPFNVYATLATTLSGPGVAAPTGLPESARAFDEPVWVPGSDGWALVAWAVEETADGGFRAWVDSDGDRDFADETARVYPPLVVPDGANPFLAAAEAHRAVPPDTLVVRQGERSARLTVEPRVYNLNRDGSPRLGDDGRPEVYVRVGLHHRGTLTLGDTTYTVLAGRQMGTDGPYDDSNTRVRIVAGDGPGDDAPFEVGQVLTAGGQSWRVVGVAPDASELVLAAADAEAVGLRVGQRAPGFAAATLDGSLLMTDDLRGRYILFEFWGTWCSPCVAYAPALAALYERFGGDRFEIVGIAADEPEAVRQFTAERGLTWPQIVEPKGQRPIVDLFGVCAFPTTILIDPDGVVVYRNDGYSESLEDVLAEALE